jgi:hypothetical protein
VFRFAGDAVTGKEILLAIIDGPGVLPYIAPRIDCAGQLVNLPAFNRLKIEDADFGGTRDLFQ